MRKVKFTQDSFDEKLGAILSEFPMLDVCPRLFFYAKPSAYLWNAYRICIRFFRL